jgi:hypothetical protein
MQAQAHYLLPNLQQDQIGHVAVADAAICRDGVTSRHIYPLLMNIVVWLFLVFHYGKSSTVNLITYPQGRWLKSNCAHGNILDFYAIKFTRTFLSGWIWKMPSVWL